MSGHMLEGLELAGLRIAVIPCSEQKLDRPAYASELYTGPLFRSALLAARAMRERGDVERILILSARHGIVALTDFLKPYNTKMGDVGTVSSARVASQLQELDAFELGLELLPLLPKAYDAKLRTAVQCVNGVRRARAIGSRSARPELLELLENPLAGSAGILEQRGRLRQLRELA